MDQLLSLAQKEAKNVFVAAETSGRLVLANRKARIGAQPAGPESPSRFPAKARGEVSRLAQVPQGTTVLGKK